jgi:hydroxymethylpyrimidine/phosphomethylpyrimidine kinase
MRSAPPSILRAMDARVALTIAGSDPSGGAGIQADLKTFHQHGVYGAAAITLLTVQNTQRVSDVVVMDPHLVGRQIDAVLEDIPPHAAKTGALGTARVVRAVAERAARMSCPLVVDPVMISKHGAPLVVDDARAAIAGELLSHAALVTPNLHEAAVLAGMEGVDSLDAMRDAAQAILARCGVRSVLVKGGHLSGDAVDVFAERGGGVHIFRAPRVRTSSLHGTGCTLSAAITAHLALGADMQEAIARAKAFVTRALETAPGLGRGTGPLNHLARS